MTRRSLLGAGLLTVCVCVGGTFVSASFAQKAAVPKQPNTVVIAREKVKELLTLMDTDKNGKISKQEWMSFMEKQFDSLASGTKGEIDPREVFKSTASLTHVRASDLGK